ncbi:hypothetical protein AXG93_1647s1020 [Marchantia polymorpha subsp. ruderalis]|uniref:Integrase catalytic domain-containing protein n=1 Tax=Marchantia polymorpha subsp. ruderalis TaxID=1480154 RepID=A0A176VEF8_MARPO|nr:hypothetical protein AXG93_1647s1020 [Marchantia polymorpha subsp. ruderalis]
MLGTHGSRMCCEGHAFQRARHKAYPKTVQSGSDRLRNQDGEAKATQRDNVATVAKFLFELIIKRYGCPLELISDRVTHFLNTVIKDLTFYFHIQHQKTTPYNPKANELIEKSNGLMRKILLNAMVNHAHDWDTKLPAALWAYPTAKKRTEQVQLKRKEAYDRRIRPVTLKQSDLALMYDSRNARFPEKLHLRWMGPYKMTEVFANGSVELEDLLEQLLDT